MSDEIKEILEDVKRHLDYVEATKQSSIRDNEIKAMYDYITNLQKELKDYKSRCEKAVEYLKKEKENYLTKGVSLADTNIGQLIVSAAVNTCSCGLNILTGGDKE